MLDQEYQTKLAAVSEAYEGDEVRLQLLGEAIDLVKQAEAAGEIPETTESSMLTLAVQMVEDHLAKEASAEDVEDAEEAPEEEEAEEADLDKEAAAHIATLADAAGYLLAERGITQEDLDKIASAEEAYQVGEYLACALLDGLGAEEAEEE